MKLELVSLEVDGVKHKLYIFPTMKGAKMGDYERYRLWNTVTLIECERRNRFPISQNDPWLD